MASSVKELQVFLFLALSCQIFHKCLSYSCGKDRFTTNSGFITSPNYPRNYGEYNSCTYNIEVDRSRRVVLTWKNFDVSGYMPACSDEGDGYVAVYTGCGVLSSYFISRFCSSNMKLPHAIYSRDHCMKIIFISMSKTAKGFQAYYYTADARQPVSTSVCKSDEDFYSSQGVIMSTNWPMPYPRVKRECEYDIKSTSDKLIKLNFMDIDTASRYSCHDFDSDYLRLKGEASRYTSSSSKTYYCGTKTPFSLKTRYYKLQLDFKVYGRRSPRRGFAVGYVTYGRRDTVALKSFSKAALAALVIGAIAVVVCIIFGCRWYKRRRANSAPTQSSGYVVPPKEPENQALYAGGAPPPYSAAVTHPTQGYPGYPSQPQPYPTQAQPYPTQAQPYPTQAPPYPQGATAAPSMQYPPGPAPYPPTSAYQGAAPGPMGAPYPPTSVSSAPPPDGGAPYPPPAPVGPSYPNEKQPLNSGTAPSAYSPGGAQGAPPYPPTSATYPPPQSGMPPPY